MEDVLRFLFEYELWIYVLLGVVFLVYFRKLLIAWKEWKTAIFGLEKENGQRKFSSALTVVGLLGVMLLAEFVLISFVVPAYPKSLLLPTPTLDLFVTSTATLSILGAEPITSINSTSTPPSPGESGCIPGQVEWLSPISGDEVTGVVDLEGIVNVLTLGFYKYEYSASGSGNWITIAAGNESSAEPFEGKWSTGQLVPGDYLLHLVVTDNLNNEYARCELQVRVVSEE